MNGQHFASPLGAGDGRIPLETRQVFPHFQVVVLRVGQIGEQAAPAELGQFKMPWRARAPSSGLCFIHHDREEVAQRCVEQ